MITAAIMEYLKCDIKKHNLEDIAELIYKTEPELSQLLLGKNKSRAIKNIIKLIINDSNTISSNNILVAYENKKVIGILIGHCGAEKNKKEEQKAILETLNILVILRLLIIDKLLIKRLLTTQINFDDFYISVIHVDEKNHRKGIGSNLIKNCKKMALDKKCSRLILDVSKNNRNGIEFYKKMGFEIYDEVNIRLFFNKISVYKMELLIS